MVRNKTKVKANIRRVLTQCQNRSKNFIQEAQLQSRIIDSQKLREGITCKTVLPKQKEFVANKHLNIETRKQFDKMFIQSV